MPICRFSFSVGKKERIDFVVNGMHELGPRQYVSGMLKVTKRIDTDGTKIRLYELEVDTYPSIYELKVHTDPKHVSGSVEYGDVFGKTTVAITRFVER